MLLVPVVVARRRGHRTDNSMFGPEQAVQAPPLLCKANSSKVALNRLPFVKCIKMRYSVHVSAFNCLTSSMQVRGNLDGELNMCNSLVPFPL